MKLTPRRWIDAFELLNWASMTFVINKSVLTEKRQLFQRLNDCYVHDIVAVRMGENDLRIDTMSDAWLDIIQRIQNFLSDRTAAEMKPGGPRTADGGEAARAGNNLSRAFDAAVTTIVKKINSMIDLTDRASFETDLRWPTPGGIEGEARADAGANRADDRTQGRQDVDADRQQAGNQL